MAGGSDEAIDRLQSRCYRRRHRAESRRDQVREHRKAGRLRTLEHQLVHSETRISILNSHPLPTDRGLVSVLLAHSFITSSSTYIQLRIDHHDGRWLGGSPSLEFLGRTCPRGRPSPGFGVVVLCRMLSHSVHMLL